MHLRCSKVVISGKKAAAEAVPSLANGKRQTCYREKAEQRRTTITVMQAFTGNAITVVIDGQEVRTLRDILPETPGLKVLFVAKTPAPGSVELGHYFQGRQGQLFWKLMKQYGLLRPTTDFEDDSLLDHGYGLTDIAKLPRPFGQEPSQAEYRAGTRRIIELVRAHRPKVVVFVYKKVLDNIIHFEFGMPKRSNVWI